MGPKKLSDKVSKASTSVGPKVPARRCGHAVVGSGTPNHTSIILGGQNNTSPLLDVWISRNNDGNVNAWVQLPVSRSASTPLPRSDFSSAMINSSLYLFGGLNCHDGQVLIYNDLWVLNTDSKTTNPKWKLLSEECPILERHGHSMVAIGELLVIFGGECLQNIFDDLWVCSLTESPNGLWKNLQCSGARPSARSNHSFVYSHSAQRIFLFGGASKEVIDGELVPLYMNDMWLLDVSRDPTMEGFVSWTWSALMLTTLGPSPRDLPGCAWLPSNQIVIFGGYGLAEVLEESDDDVEKEGELSDEINDNSERTELFAMVNSSPNTEDIAAALKDIVITDETVQMQPETDEIAPSFEASEGNDKITNDTLVAVNREDDDASSFDEDDQTSDSSSGDIELTYLSDLWIIDLSSASASEWSAASSDNGNLVNHSRTYVPAELPAVRGAVLCPVARGIACFGGFDGEKFFGQLPGVSAAIEHFLSQEKTTGTSEAISDNSVSASNLVNSDIKDTIYIPATDTLS